MIPVDVPKILRDIADKIESGEYDVQAFDFYFPPKFDPEKQQLSEANFRMLIG